MKKTPIILIIICFAATLIMYGCKTSYPVYAKKVYIDNVSTVVDSGYYLRHGRYYIVNGKKYFHRYTKPTTDSNYTYSR